MEQVIKDKEIKGMKSMKLFHAPVAALLLGCVAMSGQVSAAGWADRVSMGGFSSTNYARTNSDEPFGGVEGKGHDSQGSWADTRVGLILNANINRRFRFATQMLANKGDDFSLGIDWAFADITVTDNINLRAGKVKFPVGLVNEYVDVGYAMPWMKAPVVIYSEMGAPNGPQMTREGYTGGSFLGNVDVGDVALSADFFTGEINLDVGAVRNLVGAAFTADWDDTILLKASAYQGTMDQFPAMGGNPSPMNDAKHSGTMVGFKMDWNNVIAYAEHAQITMGNLENMAAVSWYTTLGYQIGKVLPHVTYQSYKQGSASAMQKDEQTTVTLGLRYDWLPGVALKAEGSLIKTPVGVGLFPADATGIGSVPMVAFGIDTVF